MTIKSWSRSNASRLLGLPDSRAVLWAALHCHEQASKLLKWSLACSVRDTREAFEHAAKAQMKAAGHLFASLTRSTFGGHSAAFWAVEAWNDDVSVAVASLDELRLSLGRPQVFVSL